MPRCCVLLCVLAVACAPDRLPPPATTNAALTAPRVARVGLQWGRGPELAFGVLKEESFTEQRSSGDLRLEVLGEGGTTIGWDEANPPRVCPCGEQRDHLEGDVRVPHRALLVFRVPYQTGRERVRLSQRSAEGWTQLLDGDLVAHADR